MPSAQHWFHTALLAKAAERSALVPHSALLSKASGLPKAAERSALVPHSALLAKASGLPKATLWQLTSVKRQDCSLSARNYTYYIILHDYQSVYIYITTNRLHIIC